MCPAEFFSLPIPGADNHHNFEFFIVFFAPFDQPIKKTEKKNCNFDFQLASKFKASLKIEASLESLTYFPCPQLFNYVKLKFQE